MLSKEKRTQDDEGTGNMISPHRRRSQTSLVVIAAAGTMPDSARGRTCNTCGNMGHFASVCCSGKQGKERASRTRVKTIEQHEDIDSEESDISMISDISAVTLDDLQLVSLKLVNSGSFLHFQPDTGAQSNIIPVLCTRKHATMKTYHTSDP